jgi:hypothetical protein
MSQIKSVLLQYIPEVALGGARTSASTQIDRKRLRADLRRVIKRNQLYFVIAIGMTSVLFVGLLIAVLTHLDRLEWIRGLSIATGVSFVGTITLTTNLWKAKVASEVVIVLAGSLSEEALKAALGAMIKKM